MGVIYVFLSRSKFSNLPPQLITFPARPDIFVGKSRRIEEPLTAAAASSPPPKFQTRARGSTHYLAMTPLGALLAPMTFRNRILRGAADSSTIKIR